MRHAEGSVALSFPSIPGRRTPSTRVQMPKTLAWLVRPLTRPRLLLICTRPAP